MLRIHRYSSSSPCLVIALLSRSAASISLAATSSSSTLFLVNFRGFCLEMIRCVWGAQRLQRGQQLVHERGESNTICIWNSPICWPVHVPIRAVQWIRQTREERRPGTEPLTGASHCGALHGAWCCAPAATRPSSIRRWCLERKRSKPIRWPRGTYDLPPHRRHYKRDRVSPNTRAGENFKPGDAKEGLLGLNEVDQIVFLDYRLLRFLNREWIELRDSLEIKEEEFKTTSDKAKINARATCSWIRVA